MTTDNQTPSIYNYTDYRDYLKSYFEYQKRINPKFSNRNFCLKARVPLKNSSIISKIIKGKRKLSQNLRLKFSQALNLKSDEQHYLDMMSQYTHMKDGEEKKGLHQKMLNYKTPRSKILDDNQHIIHDKWFYQVLKTYFSNTENERDFTRLASTIFPEVSKEEVQRGVKGLVDASLLVKGEGQINDSLKTTPSQNGPGDLKVKEQIKEMNSVAMEVFEKAPPNQKDYNSMSMYLSQDGYNVIKEKINTFRQELQTLLKNDTNEDRVYTLNMHFFPNMQLPGKEFNRMAP